MRAFLQGEERVADTAPVDRRRFASILLQAFLSPLPTPSPPHFPFPPSPSNLGPACACLHPTNRSLTEWVAPTPLI